MLALSVAAAAFATIALTYHEARQPTGQAITPRSARSHPQRNSHPAGRQTQPRPSITPAPGTTAAVSHARSASDAGALPSAPDSQPARPQSNTAAAVQLQAEGHQLLGEGHYENAIGDLRSALTSTGQSAAGCAQPTTEVCLTYAYALYDLGRALRLGGNPTAALPILAERLRIDNQRPVVEHELDLARTQLRASATAHPTHP
jgi:tetratricopeptide (TPR) repeat protein